MPAFLVGLSWCLAVAWLLLRAVRQFRAYETIDEVRAVGGDPSLPRLSVIIPARNEEQNIATCVESLLGQHYPAERLDLIVVDDSSTDGTARVVQRIAQLQPRLRLLSAGPLPNGWAGKPHACWQGVQSAEGDWLCFVDADTAAAPELLARAVAEAEARETDMLSLEPFQELGSFWERLIIPCGLFMVSVVVDLRAVNAPETPEAAADGQFLLIRRSVYDEIGGHASVRAEISEDTALARLVKRAGHRTRLMAGGSLIRVRMYRGLRDLWEGLSKNAVDIVRSPRAAVFAGLEAGALGVLLVLAPLWAWIGGAAGPPLLAGFGLALASAASLALFATQIATARYFHVPPWYGFLSPIGLLSVAALILDSVRKHRNGRIRWKDRVYSPSRGAAPTGAAPPE